MRLTKSVGVLVAGLMATLILPANGAVIDEYGDFSNTSGLTLLGSAASVGGAMQLTPAAKFQAGAAFTSSAQALGADGSFSTVFTFKMPNAGGLDPADGITFFMSQSAPTTLLHGGDLGYQGIPNSFAVEFDTYQNGGEPNDNHIAIDLNGLLSDLGATAPYGVTSCTLGSQVSGCLSDGNIWTANINYDGTTNEINVVVFDPTEGASFTALSNYSLDVPLILGGTSAYVGFTGGTGSGYEQQDVLSWGLANTSVYPAPEPMTILVFGAGLVGANSFRLRRKIRKD